MKSTAKKYEVKFVPEESCHSIIPLLQELDSSISDEILSERLKEMFNHNYKCAGVYDGDELIAIAGVWVLYKYYIGKHIELDDVVVKPAYRSEGVGALMMDFVYEYARSIDCVAAELNSYIKSERATAYWEKNGFEKLGYHMRKML
ncbi:GNAT family N-acetyltransferase [Flavobacteriaceae bacterium F08102]|nr:GNAT family N-acetyltransferase [Flavobacteriaceae bacterium F08102]